MLLRSLRTRYSLLFLSSGFFAFPDGADEEDEAEDDEDDDAAEGSRCGW